MQNFFSYQIIVDKLPKTEQCYKLKADVDDLSEIKKILKVPAVKSFSAEIHLLLNQKTNILKLWGSADAVLTLQSVISLEEFDKSYHNDFELTYDTKATLKSQREEEEELFYDDNTPDVVINGQIDLSDIAIEQIALIMEDYPRKAGETFSFKTEFTAEEGHKNPFEILKKLK